MEAAKACMNPISVDGHKSVLFLIVARLEAANNARPKVYPESTLPEWLPHFAWSSQVNGCSTHAFALICIRARTLDIVFMPI